MLLFVVPQLVEKIELDKQKREEMEQVRLELCLEQEDEANRQREIVSNLNAIILAIFLVPV